MTQQNNLSCKWKNDNDSDNSNVVSVEIREIHRRFNCDNNTVHTDKAPDNVCLKLKFIRMNRKKRTLLPFKKDFTFRVTSHLENGRAINRHVLNNNTLT